MSLNQKEVESHTVRLTGLSGFAAQVQRRLAVLPGEKEIAELHKSLAVTSRRIEVSMSHGKVGSANLTISSRQQRGWIALLGDLDMLTSYCQAAAIGSRIIGQAVGRLPRWSMPVLVYFRPMRGLYQMKQSRGTTILSVPSPGLIYREAEFDLIAHHIIHRDAQSKNELVNRMAQEDFQAVAQQLEILGGVVDQAAGKHFDLNEIFDRVNARYFGGQIKRPKLHWSKILTHRKFGHYDWVHDSIMLSRSMDCASVPAYVVEFVMYHELLHKVLGLKWTGSRNYAHTGEFYQREKQFAEFEEAEKAIHQLANRHRFA
jgi:hypothetical protein